MLCMHVTGRLWRFLLLISINITACVRISRFAYVFFCLFVSQSEHCLSSKFAINMYYECMHIKLCNTHLFTPVMPDIFGNHNNYWRPNKFCKLGCKRIINIEVIQKIWLISKPHLKVCNTKYCYILSELNCWRNNFAVINIIKNIKNHSYICILQH